MHPQGALQTMVREPFEQARQFELPEAGRFDGQRLRACVGWRRFVHRVLAIMLRRARMLGLDVVHAAGSADEFDPPKIKVEIVNDPELVRAERAARLLVAAPSMN